jgi:hypothetical protein
MTGRRAWTTSDSLRVTAVALLLAEGAIHLQQYEGPLNAVPTINTLFVLNAIGAAAIALVLAVVVALVAFVLVRRREHVAPARVDRSQPAWPRRRSFSGRAGDGRSGSTGTSSAMATRHAGIPSSSARRMIVATSSAGSTPRSSLVDTTHLAAQTLEAAAVEHVERGGRSGLDVDRHVVARRRQAGGRGYGDRATDV